jgi:quercetin dioxygenase-like cupin family protein
MKLLLISALAIAASCTNVFAQHHTEPELKPKTVSPLSFLSVRSEQLTDEELKTFKMESSVMTVVPGGTDTVSHRHDCELFGYVLEGSIEVGLDKKTPITYAAGQMFFEKRNILHSFTRNPSAEHPAKVLLIFIIKDGRPGYTKEYPNAR